MLVYRQNAAISTEAGPQPVRHWLPDKWTLWLLKDTYSWGRHTSLADIIEDDELMFAYFGSVEEGRSYLGRLEEWQ